MKYDQTLRKLGETTAKGLETVRLQLVEGLIDRATARDLWTILLRTAGEQGENLGALSYDTFSRVSIGRKPAIAKATGAAVLEPVHATEERITKAVDTILDGAEADMATRLQRLGFSDPVTRAQEEFGSRMSRDSRAEGWSRGIESDACELCVAWYKEGKVWPVDHPMPSHPGCTCHQVPKLKTRKEEKQEEKARDKALFDLLDRVGLDRQGNYKNDSTAGKNRSGITSQF